MTRFVENHANLASIDWPSFIRYDESSPTYISWISPTRAGRNGTPTPRQSMVAGGKTVDGRLIFVHNKQNYSIPKIVWVMHHGAIPEGKTVWFKDNDRSNASINNLVIDDVNRKIPEKYSDGIKSYIAYDESSPSCLRWIGKSSKSTNIYVGDIAGSLDDTDGYWKINGLGHYYKAHRLVWFLHNGKIPDKYDIDHIDRDRSNNKISNLRAVPRSINGKNRSKNKNNKTGVNNIMYSEFFNHRGTLIRRYSLTIQYDGNKFSKSFSLNKYGDEGAWNLALKTKEKIINELKEKGVGFTEDHGT